MVTSNTQADAFLKEGFRVQNIVPQTKQSRRRSFELVLSAAELGSLAGMAWCAEAYFTGFGVRANARKARKMAVKAANLGNARAKYLLADMMIRDRKNRDQLNAYQFALDASRAGEDDANFLLAWMLYHGYGVQEDRENAIAKLQSLSETGDSRAAKYLDIINSNSK